MPLRVLSWNVKHGRAQPPARRDLFDEFATALASWDWNVALLQEVPPWWPSRLALRLDAAFGLVLSSRNALLPLRRAIAVRWPDAIKSNGGGCNAILVRGPGATEAAEGTPRPGIDEHRVRRLCWWPERRWLHGVRLSGSEELWACNLHTAADAEQAKLAAATALSWGRSAGAAVILGGDFNVRGLALDVFTLSAEHGGDYGFALRLPPAGTHDGLDPGRLAVPVPVVGLLGPVDR